MDALILLRVAAALSRQLAGAALVRLVEQPRDRYRLVFERRGCVFTVVVRLAAAAGWVGRPARRERGRPGPQRPFAATAERSLRGAVVRDVHQAGVDRVLRLELADGQALVAELGRPAPNLVRLAAGRVVACARHPRSARERLAAGEVYRPPALPERPVPPDAEGRALDEAIEAGRAEGLDLADAIRRRVFGVGPGTAALVAQESGARGVSAGEVLAERVAALRAGEADPVIVAPEEPESAVAAGRWDPAAFRLLPWEPEPLPGGSGLYREADPSRTAGRYHQAADDAAALAARLKGLRRILARERRRLHHAERKARADLEALGDPQRHRRWGEALLAGMHDARRYGEHALVIDPYDAAGGRIEVPAPARLTLAAAAEEHFRRHRRAKRGLLAATERMAALRERGGRLEAIEARSGRGQEEAREMERAMRDAGIPVELAPRRRDAAPGGAPRVEGVRLFTSSDGWTILVGRGARSNERLTFKLAVADDFWLHVRGRAGAHVVIRNPERHPRPPRRTLLEAAAVAAWYSDARDERAAEVQWTRRRQVRRARGAPPGTVLVKRSETVRVVPALPPGAPERG